MEEVRRVDTTRKRKKGTTILLVLAGVLGLGLISLAIYFYTIGDTSKEKETEETTCACYYIDPEVISECGDPRRGFMFETVTTTEESCKTTCSTSKLSVNLLKSNTKQDLFQICQLQSVLDDRCSEMIIKDKDGKIVTGKISSTDEITIEAKFDSEYSSHKFVVNNQDTEPDVISPDKLTIKKSLSNIKSSSLNIVATAVDSSGEQINSPLCRRLLEVDLEGASNVSDIQVQTRQDTETYKISRIKIGVGNITEDKNLSIRFSFEKSIADLLMNDGFTLDSSKGEIVILEQDLYNTENFGASNSFSQLDGLDGNIKITAELKDDTGLIGSVSGSFNFPKIEEGKGDPVTTIEESKFSLSKTSNVSCVERVSPNNLVQYTITVVNQGTKQQNLVSIKDKLPLGFAYIQNSSKVAGASVQDAGTVTVNTVGETQEIVWQKSEPWVINPGQSFVVIFQSQVGANALTGSNQNEVIITPSEIPLDPTTLRAESVLNVAQDCSDPNATPTQQPTTKPTTPSTGILDSIIGRILLGIFTLTVGWYIYSKPFGKVMIEKLVNSDAYKGAEKTTWMIFKPKKYFETKVVEKLSRKKKV